MFKRRPRGLRPALPVGSPSCEGTRAWVVPPVAQVVSKSSAL